MKRFLRRVRGRWQMQGSKLFLRRALQPARLLSLLSALIPISGCNLSDSIPNVEATLTAIPTENPFPSANTTDGPGDLYAAWHALAPGLEQRLYRMNDTQPLYVLRIDPQQYGFRAHYRPGDPLRLDGWRDTLPEAVAFVNANFFDRDNNALGLLVADSVVYGSAFSGYGGLFQVQNGQARVRSNIYEPYSPGETLEQAVMAFPMLVYDGAQAYSSTAPDRSARRTIIGQDTSGNILLMATPNFGPTLVELAAFLAGTDMNLLHALNLDGGGSTLLYVNPPQASDYALRSFDSVPAVLAVYPR